MRRIALVSLLVAAAVLSGCGTRAKVEPKRDAKVYAPNNGPMCFLAGALPTDVRYEVLGRVMATKRSYGSVDQLLPVMSREARRLGADAVIHLQTDQRFKGPMPWRVTAPTGDGTAVKIVSETPRFDCVAAGGQAY